MIDKKIEIVLLMDFYKSLITDKQKDIMDLYYNYDLSISEIAEELNSTRQAVYDNIKRAELTLYKYEKKLNLLEKSNIKKESIKRQIELLEKFIIEENKNEFKKIVKNIEKLLD